MAVKDCDTISNILAIAITSWDDDLARTIAVLSKEKNSALQKSRALKQAWETVDSITGQTAQELELRASSADIKIRAIVQASILKWWKWNEAFMELANQIAKEKWSLWWWTRLLEMVRTASSTNYAEIARLWDETMDVSAAMKDLNDWLSDFISDYYYSLKYQAFYWLLLSFRILESSLYSSNANCPKQPASQQRSLFSLYPTVNQIQHPFPPILHNT